MRWQHEDAGAPGRSSDEPLHDLLKYEAAVQYISTRGGMPAKHFCEVLLEGLAPDGGLVDPDEYPHVTLHELTAWRYLSYAELAFEILRRFIDDIPASDLRALTARTYTRAVF